jgi:hypothetical protein
MRDAGERLGLTGPALDTFVYACYEVKVDLDVNEETGKAKIFAVDDRIVGLETWR